MLGRVSGSLWGGLSEPNSKIELSCSVFVIDYIFPTTTSPRPPCVSLHHCHLSHQHWMPQTHEKTERLRSVWSFLPTMPLPPPSYRHLRSVPWNHEKTERLRSVWSFLPTMPLPPPSYRYLRSVPWNPEKTKRLRSVWSFLPTTTTTSVSRATMCLPPPPLDAMGP